MRKWETGLEKYEKEIGLTDFKPLHISDQQIKSMSPEEMDENAVLLANFSVHIQKQININTSRINWAESRLGQIIAKQCSNVKAYSYEERRLIIIHNNEHAIKLNEILEICRSRLDRISFIIQRCEFLSNKLSQSSYTKRNSK